MASAVLKLCGVLLLVVGVYVAENHPAPYVYVSTYCLDCICQAVSGCEQGVQCNGDHCGPYQITRAYWAYAGNFTINGQSPDEPDAFANCANHPDCARSTLRGYLYKYAQDCNGDGIVDCNDFMAIHKLGGHGCTGQLPSNYVNVFNQCFAKSPK